jgi:hypothetical protein
VLLLLLQGVAECTECGACGKDLIICYDEVCDEFLVCVLCVIGAACDNVSSSSMRQECMFCFSPCL